MTSPTAESGTGVEWLPTLPPGWALRPLWSMFERVKDVDHPDERMLSVFRDHGVVSKDSRENLNQTAENRSIYQLVHPGWLVTNRMKAWQGSVGISPLRGIVSGHYICFAPKHREDQRYLNWMFRSAPYTHAYALMSRGVRIGQVEIDNDEYRQLPVLLPPLDVQRQIADYLDRETARIDTLIDEQHRLIEMLDERRLAVISAATGWVDRPANWLTKRLSWLFERTASGTTPANEDIVYSDQAEIPWVTTGELREKRIAGTQRGVTRESLAKYSALRLHATGSLLVAMYGATIGRMAILDIPAASNQACCALIGPMGVTPEFVQYSLLAAREWLLLEAAGGGQPNINQDTIRSFRIPVPPLEDQRRIVDRLDEQTATIDTLIAETEKFIDLAHERRSALITAAVTGQIDVPEVA